MPAPAAAENGAPRTELQELQLKSGQVTDEVRSFITNLISSDFHNNIRQRRRFSIYSSNVQSIFKNINHF